LSSSALHPGPVSNRGLSTWRKWLVTKKEKKNRREGRDQVGKEKGEKQRKREEREKRERRRKREGKGKKKKGRGKRNEGKRETGIGLLIRIYGISTYSTADRLFGYNYHWSVLGGRVRLADASPSMVQCTQLQSTLRVGL